MHFDIGIALLVFGVIFLAELPDKSLFAALALGSRFPGFYVWLGAASAFLVHVVIAVLAGRLLTLLPHQLTEAVVAVLFFAGAMLLFFGKHGVEHEPQTQKLKQPANHNPLKVFAVSFGAIFIGEWGDITQIATANYAAKYHSALSVAVGATAALWTVAALAVIVGARVLKVVPSKVLLKVMGGIMLLFAIVSAVEAIR